MKKMLLIAVLALALAAAPAFASVQNIKIGGDIESTYLVRDQFDLGGGAELSNTQDYDQKFFFTQTRLNVAADLTDNVSATVGLINERPWGDEGQDASANDIDLNLAFVTLREMLYSPLTVVVGRQNFKYGNSFIVDSAGTNNTLSSNNGLVGVATDFSKRTALDGVDRKSVV